MTFKKLVLIGVESSGKTTLAKALAKKLQERNLIFILTHLVVFKS